MKNAILTGTEARQARADLGLSQRKVATASGITRLILSHLEQEKIIPRDDVLKKLKAFYIGQGHDFDAANDPGDDSEQPAAAASSLPAPRQKKQSYPIRNGYAIAPALLDSEESEVLLEELDNVEQRIDGLLENEVNYGSFIWNTTPKDACMECQDELKTLMAYAYCLVRKLQGHWVVEPCSLDDMCGDVDTQGELLSRSFTKALHPEEFASEDE